MKHVRTVSKNRPAPACILLYRAGESIVNFFICMFVPKRTKCS